MDVICIVQRAVRFKLCKAIDEQSAVSAAATITCST
jgi:hypothetical protein